MEFSLPRRLLMELRLNTFFPPDPSPESFLQTPMSASLLQDHHFERQRNMLEKAQSEGKVVYRGESDKDRRRMGVSLVKLHQDGFDESGSLVEEEIFGPVLPIIPVQVSHGMPSNAEL